MTYLADPSFPRPPPPFQQERQKERLKNAKPLALLDQVRGLRQVMDPTPDEAKSAPPDVLGDDFDLYQSSVPVYAKPGACVCI
jgi:hypothetical protein